MRIAVTAALIAAAFPAAAHARHSARLTPEQAAAALQNPLVQEAGARALSQLIGIVLDTRVGPVGGLIEPHAGHRSDETLRDLARRDDPRFEEHLCRGTKRALGTAGVVASAAAGQAKELRRTADRLDAALAPLLDALSARE